MTYLAAVAIVQNEALYLEEWMAYHRAIGVEEFHLYDNESTDNTWRVARDLGAITYHWPGRRVQLAAHHHALSTLIDRTQWIAFIDPDEFLFTDVQRSIPDLLSNYEAYGALAACWACFGTSGVEERPTSALRTFTHRAAQGAEMNLHVKSIVQPRLVRAHTPKDPHHFLQCVTVDTKRRQVVGPFHQEPPSWEDLRINHYVSRSVSEAREKMRTPRADNGELRAVDLTAEWLNNVEDTSMIERLDGLGV
jgi:hypothetical protein